MRTIGISAVVIIHVASRFSQNVILYHESWWLVNFLNIASRWGVPVFFMLSGALLLDSGKQMPLKQFYSKRLKRIGIPLVFWSIFYLIWRFTVRDTTFIIKTTIYSLVVGRPMFHLWFLYALSAIYLVTPMLQYLFRETSLKQQWTLTVSFFAVSSGSAVLWTLLGDIGWRIPPRPVVTTEWIYYLGYFTLGYLVRDLKLSRRQIFTILFTFPPLVICASVGYYMISKFDQAFRAEGIFHCYLSPIVVVMSSIVYLLISNIFTKDVRFPLNIFKIQKLSDASFGVYLIHIVILDYFWLILRWPDRMGLNVYSLVTLIFAVLSSSYFFVIIFRRISLVRTIVG